MFNHSHVITIQLTDHLTICYLLYKPKYSYTTPMINMDLGIKVTVSRTQHDNISRMSFLVEDLYRLF